MHLPLPPARPERIGFLGTPEIAVPTLRALRQAGYTIPIVVTRSDKRRGRGGRTSPSPVKAAALDLGLEVTTELDDVADERHGPVDMAVVVAYGRLIPTAVLAEVPMVNLHFSALPRWRGAAPIERAILAGDETTAVTVITVAEELDAGDVWSQVEVEIGVDETAAELAGRLAHRGASLVVETIKGGFPASVAQSGEITYASKIGTEDRRLDFSRTAVEVQRTIRIGGAWTTFRDGRLKIWEAEIVDSGPEPGQLHADVVGCGNGALRLITVQPDGKQRMPASAWLNGARPADGEVLGNV